MLVTLYVNDRREVWEVKNEECLADSLRDHGDTSVKTGCFRGPAAHVRYLWRISLCFPARYLRSAWRTSMLLQ